MSHHHEAVHLDGGISLHSIDESENSGRVDLLVGG
jgi:hypothetical protein